ncbi:hypothetical protein COLO4_35662 [Corchorus olitorius]|uniref:Uncharacterized protein n=1 Tax=Corchorus olitorius TaxID=93759 RepID=A0A1R3GE95_9ROSI|nr:hypothetical protein COLO4_35662 [Corchorus olitorius]
MLSLIVLHLIKADWNGVIKSDRIPFNLFTMALDKILGLIWKVVVFTSSAVKSSSNTVFCCWVNLGSFIRFNTALISLSNAASSSWLVTVASSNVPIQAVDGKTLSRLSDVLCPSSLLLNQVQCTPFWFTSISAQVFRQSCNASAPFSAELVSDSLSVAFNTWALDLVFLILLFFPAYSLSLCDHVAFLITVSGDSVFLRKAETMSSSLMILLLHLYQSSKLTSSRSASLLPAFLSDPIWLLFATTNFLSISNLALVKTAPPCGKLIHRTKLFSGCVEGSLSYSNLATDDSNSATRSIIGSSGGNSKGWFSFIIASGGIICNGNVTPAGFGLLHSMGVLVLAALPRFSPLDLCSCFECFHLCFLVEAPGWLLLRFLLVSNLQGSCSTCLSPLKKLRSLKDAHIFCNGSHLFSHHPFYFSSCLHAVRPAARGSLGSTTILTLKNLIFLGLCLLQSTRTTSPAKRASFSATIGFWYSIGWFETSVAFLCLCLHLDLHAASHWFVFPCLNSHCADFEHPTISKECWLVLNLSTGEQKYHL